MPDSFNVDKLTGRIVFVAGVEQGLQDIEAGKTVPHSEIAKMLEEWKK